MTKIDNKMEANTKEITLVIDGAEVKSTPGKSVLEVARQIGVDIPTLCYHNLLSPYGGCRLCSVEVTNKQGRKRIVTSCNFPVEEGLVVETNSENVMKVRRGILELLMARCPKVVKLKNLGQKYGITEQTLWASDQDEDCILCGLCVRVCEELIGVSAISFAKRGVEREVTAPYGQFSDDCIGCGACALVCPTGSKKIRIHTYAIVPPLKGTRDEKIGVHTDIFSVKNSAEDQQDFMKALLAAGFKKGLIDTAVFTRRKDGYTAEAVMTGSVEDVINAKAASFLRIKIVSKLMEAIEQGKRKIAFIGLPCQVKAVRKIQQTLQNDFPDLELTSIGLFCKHSFDPQKLKEEIRRLLGVDIGQAEKTRMQDGKFIIQVEGKEYSCNIEQLNSAIEKGCVYCNDFPAFFADVAIGSFGSEADCSTVIVRTERGKNLIETLDLTRCDVKKDEVSNLSDFKKNRAKEHMAPILKEIYAQRAKKEE
jgi:coenzyme F420-reducing hydrogenase beta subunit